MKAGNILPWIARKSRVPEALAKRRWAQAMRCVTDQPGAVDTSGHWKVAMGRLYAQPISMRGDI
jgi:hypothetical protein